MFIDKNNGWLILDTGSKLMYFDIHSYLLVREEERQKGSEMAYLGDETFAYKTI
jgi:hypothetical protein